MKFPKGLLKGITVFLVVCLIGYIVIIRVVPEIRKFTKEEPVMAPQKEQVKKAQLTVQAGQVIRSDLIMRTNGAGEVRPYREIPIRPRIPGEVLSVYVKEGDFVRKGALLFTIDSTEKYLAFKERETQWYSAVSRYVLESGVLSENIDKNSGALSDKIIEFIDTKRKEWEEAEDLLKSGAIDKEEYDNRRMNFQVAEALSKTSARTLRAGQFNLISSLNTYERAKYELENTRVYAPISGVVSNLTIQKGYEVGGSEVLRILDISKVKVAIGVLEPDVTNLEKGREARVTLNAAFPNEVFNGVVETISPVIENKTCEVAILVDNPGRRIKPGMFAMAEIDAVTYPDRLLVPTECVTDRDGRPTIFIIQEGIAKWNYVTIGLQNNEFTEILSAEHNIIRPGDLVITSGHINIAHDVPVTVVNPLPVK